MNQREINHSYSPETDNIQYRLVAATWSTTIHRISGVVLSGIGLHRENLCSYVYYFTISAVYMAVLVVFQWKIATIEIARELKIFG